jgi:hypothetical protein
MFLAIASGAYVAAFVTHVVPVKYGNARLHEETRRRRFYPDGESGFHVCKASFTWANAIHINRWCYWRRISCGNYMIDLAAVLKTAVRPPLRNPKFSRSISCGKLRRLLRARLPPAGCATPHLALEKENDPANAGVDFRQKRSKQ